MRRAGTTTAAEIASVGPSTVQTDLDRLDPITTLAELEARFPPVAGVIPVSEDTVIDGGAFPTGIDLGVQQIELIPPRGHIICVASRVNIRSAITTGAVCFGQGNVTGVNWIQVDTGPSSMCVDITSTGLPLRWQTVGLTGINPGKFENSGGLTLQAIFCIPPLSGSAAPLTFTGAIGGLDIDVGCARGTPGDTPYTLIDLPAGFTLAGGADLVLFVNSNNAGDRAIHIDSGITIGANTSMRVEATITGAAAGLVYESPGLDYTSPEVRGEGGNGRQSRWIADLKSTTFNFTHQVSTWEFLPAGGFAMVTPPTQRYLFADPWVKSTSRDPVLEDVRALEYKMTLDQAAGGPSRTVSMRVVQREGDLGSITVVPGTEADFVIAGVERPVDITVTLAGTNETQFAIQTFSADAAAFQTAFTTPELLVAWAP